MKDESNRNRDLSEKMKALACFFEMHEKWAFIIVLFMWLLLIAAIYLYKNCYRKVYAGDFAYSKALRYSIDDVSTKNAQINGWCLKPGSNITTYDINLILWSDALGYGYVVPTMMQSRKDISEYMDDKYDYEKSGFSCIVNPKFIKKEAYRILIQYRCNDNNEVVETGEYYIPDYSVTYQKPNASEKLAYYIDSVSEADGTINGWCFKKGKDLEHFHMDLIFWNEVKSYGYRCPVYMLEDENITAEFDDGYNYDKSRFLGIVDRSLIHSGNYKIFIHYQCDGEDEMVDTKKSFYVRE